MSAGLTNNILQLLTPDKARISHDKGEKKVTLIFV